MNRETEKLYYNQRLIIDNNVITEPRTWQISKINRIHANGLNLVTCAQTFFDEHHDYIELDEDGNVIGMWADYFLPNVNTCDNKEKPQVPEFEEDSYISYIHSEISYSGTRPEMKIGGSYKNFNVTFYKGTDEIDAQLGIWTFSINDEDVLNKLTFDTDYNDTTLPTRFKIDKQYRNDFVGKILTIKYTSNTGIVSELDIKLLGL